MLKYHTIPEHPKAPSDCKDGGHPIFLGFGVCLLAHPYVIKLSQWTLAYDWIR